MAQQHGFELQPRSKASGAGIFPSTREVADGFIALIGHDHLNEVASPRLPSQKHRIEPIGLDELFGGLARDVNGGDDFAPPAVHVEVACPAVAAGACLVPPRVTIVAASIALQ